MENTKTFLLLSQTQEETIMSLSSSRIPLGEVTNVVVSSVKMSSTSDFWSEMLNEILLIKEDFKQLGKEFDEEMKNMDTMANGFADSMKKARATVKKSNEVVKQADDAVEKAN